MSNTVGSAGGRPHAANMARTSGSVCLAQSTPGVQLIVGGMPPCDPVRFVTASSIVQKLVSYWSRMSKLFLPSVGKAPASPVALWQLVHPVGYPVVDGPGL